jgi:hypothetical protein
MPQLWQLQVVWTKSISLVNLAHQDIIAHTSTHRSAQLHCVQRGTKLCWRQAQVLVSRVELSLCLSFSAVRYQGLSSLADYRSNWRSFEIRAEGMALVLGNGRVLPDLVLSTEAEELRAAAD